VELLMPRTTKKPLKSVIAETLSSMTPKKAKKPENVIKLELLSRILESLIKVGYPSRFKSFLSDF